MRVGFGRPRAGLLTRECALPDRFPQVGDAARTSPTQTCCITHRCGTPSSSARRGTVAPLPSPARTDTAAVTASRTGRRLQALAYRASKAALNMFTVPVAQSLEGTRIEVNAAAPGYTSTDHSLREVSPCLRASTFSASHLDQATPLRPSPAHHDAHPPAACARR